MRWNMETEFWAFVAFCFFLLASLGFVAYAIRQLLAYRIDIASKLDEPWYTDTREYQEHSHTSQSDDWCPQCETKVKLHEIRQYRCPCCAETIRVIHA